MTDVLQGEVKVPGLGKTKKSWVVVGVGGAAAFVGYRWYKARSAPAATVAPTDYSTDPNAADYGLNTTGGAYNPTGNTGATTTTTDQVLTNAAWTNQAVALLSDSGYDPQAVRAALGDFLGRLSLTTAEATIARASLASAGQPPVGGPWTVVEQATTGSTGSLDAPKNLRKWNAPTANTASFQWDAVTGAASYAIYRNGVSDSIGSSTDTKFNAGGLTENTSYSFTVKALGSTGKASSASNTYTVKTPGIAFAKPTGLKSSAITASSFRVSCTPVKGATVYNWHMNGAAHGVTTGPSQEFTHLHANTAYTVQVAADTTNQKTGPFSSTITVKTKK